MNIPLNRNHAIKIPDELLTSAADTLLETLQFYHITQTDFAERIGVSQKTVSDILNRKQFLSIELAKRVEEVTGIPAKILLRLDLEYRMVHKEDKPDHTTHSDNYLKPYDWVVA
jgi:plasmid maintenance system antidote protein VapI